MSSERTDLVIAQNQQMPVLTGIRGWAALWVLLYHAWGQSGSKPIILGSDAFGADLTPFFRMGGAGVTVFFVLSGFLLSLPFAAWQAGLRDKPTTGAYLMRRVARVFPAYYAQLAVLILISAIDLGWSAVPNAGDMCRHLLMLFMPPPLGMEPMNLVWWTLPIEFSFYLVLPIVAVLLHSDRWPWLLASVLTSMIVWRYFAVTWLADSSIQARVYAAYQLPGSMDSFGFGMLASILHVKRKTMLVWLRRPACLELATLLGVAVLVGAIYWLHYGGKGYWSNTPIFYLWTPALSLGITAIVLAGTGGGRIASLLFANRFMVYAGLVSYSVYLWHFPILVWMKSQPFVQSVADHRLAVLLLAGMPTTLAVASISYLLVERPCLRLRLRVRG
ncbi:MAG: acyltransferase [Sterolibacteriaceae bacterium]|nr:acyltransferase [Candidatus Methylophosphatis haderslevensis]